MREFHIWHKMFVFSLRFGFGGLMIAFGSSCCYCCLMAFFEGTMLKSLQNFPTCLFRKGLVLLFFPSPHS